MCRRRRRPFPCRVRSLSRASQRRRPRHQRHQRHRRHRPRQRNRAGRMSPRRQRPTLLSHDAVRASVGSRVGRGRLPGCRVHRLVQRRGAASATTCSARTRHMRTSWLTSRNTLRDGGHELFKAPAMQQFDLGKFRDDAMAYPPSVVVKDYTWTIDGDPSAGYLVIDGASKSASRRSSRSCRPPPSSDARV